jgi:hypothetical protein
VLFPGTSGFSLMPRKMSGIAMIMIEASMVASSTPAVVLVSATHLYRGPTGSWACPAPGSASSPAHSWLPALRLPMATPRPPTLPHHPTNL